MNKVMGIMGVLILSSVAFGADVQFNLICPEGKICDGNATEQEVIGRVIVMVARGWDRWPFPVYGVVIPESRWREGR